MNIVIFASDAKGVSSLNSIVQEASSRGHKLFVMICQDTQLRYPLYHKNRFEILTNCDPVDPVFSQTLGVEIPFKPDWLLIQRERWEPESSIIHEFKVNFKCKVGLVEPNANMLNNSECILENMSKNRFVPYIDAFFDHSEWTKNQRRLAQFKGKSIVVGNPKYDSNFEVSDENINFLKSHYNIDPNKKQVLFFSIINFNRKKVIEIYKNYIKDNPDCQFFYKPFPGEPFDPQFKNDYYPSFFLENCKPIIEETHIWGMFDLCDTHIGCVSSITHASLLKGKNLILIDNLLNNKESYVQTNNIFDNKGGIENKVNWVEVLNLKDVNELKSILNKEIFEQIKDKNQKVWDMLDTPQSLITLYDDFNDGKASTRIINFIENGTV